MGSKKNGKDMSHTHLDYFLPVPIAEVVVQGIMSRPWPHLLGTLHHWVDISPTSLRCLAISPANALHKVE